MAEEVEILVKYSSWCNSLSFREHCCLYARDARSGGSYPPIRPLLET